MTPRQRFLNASRCLSVDRTPVWLMRQAGRALPEYRALKERHSFRDLIRTPDLAAEVTLQPIRRFDFDAAVLFSDILVVSEALGQSFEFRNGGGIDLEFAIRSAEDVARLEPERVVDGLEYVAGAIRLVRRDLGERTALLGFAGSPWTLANFMMEGGSAREFTRAKTWFYTQPDLFQDLMRRLTEAVTSALRLQIDAGVDAVQIFESLGGLLADGMAAEASAKWIGQIIEGLGGRVPVIVFCRGVAGSALDTWVRAGARALSVDWAVNLRQLRERLSPEVAVQGNLDPVVLHTTPAVTTRETRRILDSMRGRPGHIFNLGHGVTPDARLENIEALVHTVREGSAS